MSHEEITKLELVYTRCYCEENIWKLCESVRQSLSHILSDCFAVFISNDVERIPLWSQKASDKPDGFIMWDYHVIFVYRNMKGPCLVYDFDTTLSFPCVFKNYVDFCIKREDNISRQFHRCFRVIHAEEFLSNFASDRSHMKHSDGSWHMPPPQYPPITAPTTTNNIRSFISMDPNQGFGMVMKLEEFINFFLDSDVSHASLMQPLTLESLKQITQF